jgi:hypothetical protein
MYCAATFQPLYWYALRSPHITESQQESHITESQQE